MSTPTQRSLDLLREKGYLAERVERWNPYMRRDANGEAQGGRQDLFGLIDIVAVGEGVVLGVQTTTRGCLSDHLKKIRSHENFPFAKRGMRIVVHGWFKQRGRWHVKQIELGGPQ